MKFLWLPRPWDVAKQKGNVFEIQEITDAVIPAVRLHGKWQEQRTDSSMEAMLIAVGHYLDTASSKKRFILSQSWSFCGIIPSMIKSRYGIYWAPVALNFVFSVACAAVGDFPAGIGKPNWVIGLDVFVELLELCILIAHAHTAEYSLQLHALTGVTGFGGKVGRAYLIAALTSQLVLACDESGTSRLIFSPIRTNRDQYGAFGPAVVAAVKAVLLLMAQPVDPVFLVIPNGPLGSLMTRGIYLSRSERAELLGDVTLRKYPKTVADIWRLT